MRRLAMAGIIRPNHIRVATMNGNSAQTDIPKELQAIPGIHMANLKQALAVTQDDYYNQVTGE